MANLRNRLLLVSIFCCLIVGCGDINSDVATLTISPTTVSVGINQAQNFTVTAQNSAGFIVAATVAWSADSSIGTISSTSGLFQAGNSAATGLVTATAGDVTAIAAVTITDTGWITGVVNSDLGLANNIKVYLTTLPTVYTRTNTTGNYTLSGIPAGSYTVQTEQTTTLQGGTYETVTVTRGGTTIDINFFLPLQPGIPPVPTTTIPFI